MVVNIVTGCDVILGEAPTDSSRYLCSFHSFTQANTVARECGIVKDLWYLIVLI